VHITQSSPREICDARDARATNRSYELQTLNKRNYRFHAACVNRSASFIIY
jgi:hypothetical protein